MVNSLISLQKAEIPEESRMFFSNLESRISMYAGTGEQSPMIQGRKGRMMKNLESTAIH